MQDTYMTAYREIYSLNDTAKFVPWVNQIAVNKCRNIVIKKTPVIMDIDNIDNQQLEENENFLPEEYISQKEKRKLVMDIMRERLSDIQYQTVILYYFNSLTIEEVADIMECPPGTVKYRLSIARGKIKEGVLQYEKKTNEKLYSMSTIPFLASLLVAEVGAIDAPYIFPEIVTALTGGATAVASAGVGTAVGNSFIASAGASQAGATVAKATVGTVVKTGLGALKVKIAIGVTAAVIAAGGTAAIIIHNNSNKKEVIEYGTFEPRNVDELIEYFETEYGFVYYPEQTGRNEDKKKEYHKLDLVEGNITISLQLDVSMETGMPKHIVVMYESINYNEDWTKWIEVSSFLCEDSEEKAQLEEAIRSNVETEITIGKYRYVVRESGSLGYSGTGEAGRVLIIYPEWE